MLKRRLVDFLRVAFNVSQRRACRCIGIGMSSYRYKSRAKDRSALARWLRELAWSRVRFGYRRLHVLLWREGCRVNHKCVYRLYKLEELSLRLKTRKKRISRTRGTGGRQPPRQMSAGAWISSQIG